MNHFNYELDERSLRLQLKDLEVPANEEAWRKFERFSDVQPKTRNEHKFNFQVVMNRNVILPVVFGVVIILFSFLLFNFISIKDNKQHGNQQKAELNTVPVSKAKAEVKTTVSEPIASNQDMSKTAITPKANTDPKPEVAAAVQSRPENLQPATAQQLEPFQEASATQQAAIVPADNSVNASANVELKKKIRKRVKVDEMQDIRPTVVSDETEAEVHPN